MKATLIIYAKTGEVCNVIYGKEKPAEGHGQKREFIHMVADIPESTEKELDEKTREVDLSKQYTPEQLKDLQDKTKVNTLEGTLKNPIKTVYTKEVLAAVEVMR